MTRVAVIDDEPVVGQGTASVLRSAGFDVVGVATSLDEAVAVAVREVPDVIVCDVMLSGSPGGLDLPARLAATPASDSAVVFLSSYRAPWFVTRAVKEGGSGYLLKSAPVDELVAAVHSVASGGLAFRAAALRAANSYERPTDRELEIIALVVAGASNGEIGAKLHITDGTVETHLRALFARYGINSRTQLAMHAVGEGWLSMAAPGKG
jgi:DNA-binding NarL/FixJ family response regulator